MITSPQNLKIKKDTVYVFCAGPIQGAPNWQAGMPKWPDVTFINPRREKISADFDWNEQVKWETTGLRLCDFILFWIPAEMTSIAGRDYAQTTKIELIENLVRGKNIVLGIDLKVHTRHYLTYKYQQYTGGQPIFDNLSDCLSELKKRIDAKNKRHKIFFTSDTHFSSERAFTLSRRPFFSVEEMDWSMVERWNTAVGINDDVYHLGDFGNIEFAQYLNGKIHLLLGNYERDKKSLIPENIEEIISDDIYKFNYQGAEFLLAHEPVKLREKTEFGLFGHIHSRQPVKKYGLDVGVDAHYFTPIDVETVLWYKNAIENFYDNNVFT